MWCRLTNGPRVTRAEAARRSLPFVAATAAGAAVALAFAPFGLWPLAILGPAALMALWDGATPRRAAALGFCFNAGTFAAGTYWLYISIHIFGAAPLWVAFLLMLGLVAIMGGYHALLGYAVARWLPARGAWRWLVGIPAAWLLVEWLRGWLLSGFSWLSLGYSQTDTWLARLAPVGGVYLLSAALLVCAGALVMLVRTRGVRARVIAALAFGLPWALAPALDRDWTAPSGPPVQVAVLQGAIPQDIKWLETNRDTTLTLYAKLTREALGTPLIVMPESALPDLANNLAPFLGRLYSEASAHGSALVLGLVRASDDGRDFYNSVVALGEHGVMWYDKYHLVPFAEFFPVPKFVRRWLRLMSLPYSDFTRGRAVQPPLRAAGLSLAAGICYEDAYGSTLARALPRADALVNVTNDAWFGHSTARYQHFQIARMRAIESDRFMVRAANDGISAVVGPRGEVVAEAPEYQATVLRASITPRRGLPPYARVGNWAVVSLAAAALAAAILTQSRRKA
ncbi:MAG: Apolipoprotein N-acyltransferase [Steroidobacteraceae bacterium]|nr:Apolipoprotein N-acyltransferase [Steroidobacteraceae bacterium]